MKFTRTFTEINKHDVAKAGGKGASLGEMTNAGFPVPSGFVVLACVFDKSIKETHIAEKIEEILSRIDHKDYTVVEQASKDIQSLIYSQSISKAVTDEIQKQCEKLDVKYVAVRSSATVEDGTNYAWAGQLESYLNVRDKEVLSSIKQCFASLFTPRAIFYRFENNLQNTEISVAVVIQEMINAEKSGVAFSVHPVTEDKNQIVIEACFGSGEVIVLGRITPDSYVIEKESRKILSPEISSGVLDQEEILQLGELVMRIEKHYGFPCDIEWAYEAEKFYIVQSRPITTLGKKVEEKQTDAISFKELTKIATREHSLIYFSVWSDADRKDLREYGFDIKATNLFLGEGKTGRTSVWYVAEELDVLGDFTGKKVSSDRDFLEKIKNSYFDSWNILLSYIKIEKHIEHIEEFKSVYQEYVEWWSAMSLMSDAGRNIEAVREILNEARKETERYSEEIDKLFLEYLERIYPQYKEIHSVLLPEELYLLAEASLTEDQIHVIRKRLDGYILFSGQIYLLSELEHILKENRLEFEQAEGFEDGRLNGKSASPGIARGRVHILRYKHEIAHFKQGEILITEMTTPDFVPAMQKASAIVTDEGGMTSHAAIIARELRKPCVVGTQLATKTFKDGDLIEVDAINGIVRKL